MRGTLAGAVDLLADADGGGVLIALPVGLTEAGVGVLFHGRHVDGVER